MRRVYLLSGLVAVLLVAWALHGVDWRAVLVVLTSLTPTTLMQLLAVDAIITLLFSARWWLILRSQGYRLPYRSLAAYRLAGFAVSYFTPGSQFGGEPLQIYLLHQRDGVPAPTAVASVTLDKLLELLANFAFVSLGILAMALGGLPLGLPTHVALLAMGLILASLVTYSAALWMGRTPLGWLLKQASHWVRGRHIQHRLHLLAQGLAAAEGQISTLCRQQPRLVWQASGLSALVWVAVVFEFWLALQFFGVPATPLQAVSLLTLVRLALLTPLPGALGAFEAGQVMAFSALGFPVASAIALSIFIRTRDISLGLLGLAVGARLISSPGLSVLPRIQKAPFQLAFTFITKALRQKRTESP